VAMLDLSTEAILVSAGILGSIVTDIVRVNAGRSGSCGPKAERNKGV
jgi:hypothetical protein